MNNNSSKKGLMTGMTHPDVDTPTIPPVKENNNGKSDNYFVKHKLGKDPTSSTRNLMS